jgi:phosphoadenosine phosphosulfate reductase
MFVPTRAVAYACGMAAPEYRRSALRELAAAAGQKFESAPAEDVLGWALEAFGDEFCLSASMADAVVIDLATRIQPGVNVIFLDTGYHFSQTLETKDRVSERYPIRLHTILPKQTVAEQDQMFGSRLHDRDPDACCNLRKVEPLRRSLAGYVAWASGIRRDEADSRRRVGVVEWDANRHMVKVNPIATWTQDDVDRYIAEYDVVVNPLLAQGYPSIGCEPCTRKVAGGEDPRSGRWAGSGKTECGLHVDSSGRLVRSSGESPAT